MNRQFKRVFFSVVLVSLIFGSCRKPTCPSTPSPDIIWEKTYGGEGDEAGFSIQETSDGGYIIAGFTSSYGAGDNDVYLVKTDVDGEILWTSTFGGSYDDIGFSVQEVCDGSYIVAGFSYSFGAGHNDIYLLKTDKYGNELWEKTYGGTDGDACFSVQETSDKGYIITGFTESFGAGENDVYIIKTDVNGDTLWTKTYGGSGFDRGSSVQETTDCGYIVTGWTSSFGAGYSDVYLIKTDSSGDSLWTKTYGGAKSDEGNVVQETYDGGYIIGGSTSSFGVDRSAFYLIKIDVDGNVIWEKTYGEVDSYFFYSLQETSDGGYIAVGARDLASSPSFYFDLYIIKIDANGNAIWTKTYETTDSERGCSVIETSDGGYIIVGERYYISSETSDVYLLKIK